MGILKRMYFEIAEFNVIEAWCEYCGVKRDWENKEQPCDNRNGPHIWHEETGDEENERLFDEACEKD